MPKYPVRCEDLTGRTFERLTVLERAENRRDGSAQWKCQCKCGNIRTLRRHHLIGKDAYVSCGCYSAEATGKRALSHGHTRRVNGRSSTSPEYRSWNAMIQRCLNPNAPEYKYYGGRGISICEKWKTFASFYADMGDRPPGKSLDRKDPNGNYEPSNCRWATRSEQASNKRNSLLIAFKGKSQCAMDWSQETGIPYSTIRGRCKRGLSPEEILKEFITSDKAFLRDVSPAELSPAPALPSPP